MHEHQQHTNMPTLVGQHQYKNTDQEDHKDHQNTGHAQHNKHNGHAGHSEAMFQRPFWISLILSIPVLVYADLFEQLLGYHAPAFTGTFWLAPILGSIIYGYGGWVFLRGSFAEIRTRQPGMMTLVSLAITTAYLYSLVVTFHLVDGMPFYWELATLVTIMLLGHWMEMRATGSAQSALRELAKLLPDQAERLTEQGTEIVAISALRDGDQILIRPGSKIPADAIVFEGESTINESMVTGESKPVKKSTGDSLIAGTINSNGSLRATISRTGEQTMLAGIMRLVEEAQNSRSRAQTLADKAASILAYVALGAAIVTFISWSIVQGINDQTLEYVVTTLVVACPHALGLAIPLVTAISTTLSAKNGILVRDRLALEQARQLSLVIFDKTGTLTKGEQGVVSIITEDDMKQEQAIALAAAIEGDSEHIIAHALLSLARERKIDLPKVTTFQALPGKGVEATINNRTFQVGGPRLLEQLGLTVSPSFAKATELWGKQGLTIVYLVENTRILAAFALTDVIRPESREAILALKRQGIRVALLTGDSQDVANWVANELDIKEVFAQVLPEQKHQKIEELKAQGLRVAMVGDGVNDAPALAAAHVGIAIGAGTDVARASAGIVLVKNDPRDVVRIIRLSQKSYRKMIQNLSWAVGYNAIALPLAAGVLAPIGFILPPAIGAFLMSLSTIIVALNAQTLRKLHL